LKSGKRAEKENTGIKDENCPGVQEGGRLKFKTRLK